MTAVEFQFIQALARQDAAMVLGDDKQYFVETRLSAVAQAEGYPSVSALIGHLRMAPDARVRKLVIEALLVHETMFFRDGHPFEVLQSIILPKVLAGRRPDQPVCMWSAACASGQEAYSLAILVRELAPALSPAAVRILATDLSSLMIRRAQTGRFPDHEVARGLPPNLLAKYFHRDGSGWRIATAVRELIEFRQLNLANPMPALPMFDVILLRNVLIYVDADMKRTILARIRQVLRPNGYLLLGSAESSLSVDGQLQAVRLGATICYRHRDCAAADVPSLA